MGNRDEQLPQLSPKNSATATALSHNPERHITVKVEHLDPCMAPATKDVERSASRILSKNHRRFFCTSVQIRPINTFSQHVLYMERN
jgi:hypothetical protein